MQNAPEKNNDVTRACEGNETKLEWPAHVSREESGRGVGGPQRMHLTPVGEKELDRRPNFKRGVQSTEI